MSDCRIERIERAGHALFTDQPDAFAESMERFLADATSPTP
ncbi:MAG: alpha/beta hydrolase [Betaproteobacteria bacterium]|nr:alpha/beta hydrolase [Betaproteobacteria bacterium]